MNQTYILLHLLFMRTSRTGSVMHTYSSVVSATMVKWIVPLFQLVLIL